MPEITLPDGSKRHYENAVTVMEVAQSIGSGLAKATLAGKVNQQLVDASTLITDDAALQIITAKDAEGNDKATIKFIIEGDTAELENMRRTTFYIITTFFS